MSSKIFLWNIKIGVSYSLLRSRCLGSSRNALPPPTNALVDISPNSSCATRLFACQGSIFIFYLSRQLGKYILMIYLPGQILGCTGKNAEIIMVDKITSNLNMHLRFSLHFRQKLRILTLARTLCYLDCGNPIYRGPYLPRQNVLECSLQSYDS